MSSPLIVTFRQSEIDWDKVVDVAAEAAGAILLSLYGCSSTNGHSGNGGPGDASDVDDVTDVEASDVPTDVPEGDVDVTDADETDGETTPDCDDPVRNPINDMYASLNISSYKCNPTDIDILEDKLFGVCDYPVNQVFTCQIGSDSGVCRYVAELPMFNEADGTNMHPEQITNLADDRFLVLMSSEGADTRNDMLLLDATNLDASSFSEIQRFSIPSIDIGSPGHYVTLVPRYLHSALLLEEGENVLITSTNYNSATGLFERGSMMNLPFYAPPISEFDRSSFGSVTFDFTSSRNTQAVAAMDESTVAVLNSYGTDIEIPVPPDTGEISAASIDVYDVTTPIAPSILRTVELGDVKIQDLPEMVLIDGGMRALVASTDDPPVIYNAYLGSSPSVTSVSLPGEAMGEVRAMAYSPVTDRLYVSMSDGFLYIVNVSAMTVDSTSVYLGYEPMASVISADGNTLYQSVIRPCGIIEDDPHIITVDVTAL